MSLPIPFREGEEYLEAKVIPKRLGRHFGWIYRILLRGDCQGTKAAGRWYITAEQWQAFLNRSNGGGSNPTRPGVEGTRSESQRRRDDAKAAKLCETQGV